MAQGLGGFTLHLLGLFAVQGSSRKLTQGVSVDPKP